MNIFGKIRMVEALKNRREPESVHVLADEIWHALMIVGVLGTLIIVAFNLWQFTSVDQAISIQPTVVVGSSEKLPFEKSDLQAAADAYTKRQAVYRLYSSSSTPAATPDPFEIKQTKPTKPAR